MRPSNQVGYCIVNCVFMSDACGSGYVVVLQGLVVFDAEAKVDGFAAANVAIDHGVLVQPRTGFDQAEAGGVPRELDVGSGEKG